MVGEEVRNADLADFSALDILLKCLPSVVSVLHMVGVILWQLVIDREV